MKKFYEAPVVELTGFTAEDVITTSVTVIDATTAKFDADTFNNAVANKYGATVKGVEYNGSNYTW